MYVLNKLISKLKRTAAFIINIHEICSWDDLKSFREKLWRLRRRDLSESKSRCTETKYQVKTSAISGQNFKYLKFHMWPRK